MPEPYLQHVRTLCAACQNSMCSTTQPPICHTSEPYLQHVRTLCAAHHNPICHMTKPASPPARVLCEPACQNPMCSTSQPYLPHDRTCFTSCSCTLRASMSIIIRAPSATEAALMPGQVQTGTPLACAASMAMLLYPSSKKTQMTRHTRVHQANMAGH